MKKNDLFLIICLIGIISCKGPQGDVGPAGSQGVAGTVGAAGPQGVTGNANVVYSEWITPTWVSDGDGTTAFYFKTKDNSMAILTQEAIDKGIVYVYFKGKVQNYNQDTKEYELVERVNANALNSYYKIPGRTTNNFYDYGYVYAGASGQIGVNYLYVWGQIYKTGYNAAGQTINLPELAGKTFTFYNDIAKNLHQYRVVVVHGSTKGRLGNIDWKNYEEVKAALNLKD